MSVVGTLFAISLLGFGGLVLWNKATAETVQEQYIREHRASIARTNAQLKAKIDSILKFGETPAQARTRARVESLMSAPR